MAAEFPAKLDQLAIIISPRAYEDNLITRALTILHNDVLSHSQAICIYVTRGLIDGLIGLCRSSSNYLVISLSTSLLFHCCFYSNSYMDIFFQSNGPVQLLAMVSARDNAGRGADFMNQTLLLHEQAAKLLVLLSSNSKYHHQLLGLGLLKKVIELTKIFDQDSLHRECCFDKLEFSPEARAFTKKLTVGRKLVGKINPDQSAGSSKGTLNVLAVDLYDTSTDKDICINKELLKLGAAWPDNMKKENDAVMMGKLDDKVWSDFYVTKVVDAHCFWAFIDDNAPSTIEKMSQLIEDYVYSSDVCPLDGVSNGTRACFALLNECSKPMWVRSCVLEVDLSNNQCILLLVDYGYVMKVQTDVLFPLPDAVKSLNHQVNLCVLEGIKAAPKRTDILKYAGEILCNISSCGQSPRMYVHQTKGTDALLKFCQLPDKKLIKVGVTGLANLALNFNIRAQIGFNKGCEMITDLIKEYYEDNDLLESLLYCFTNITVECIQNRKRMAGCNALLVLVKVFHSKMTSIKNQNLILTCLKNLIGDGWRMLDPINVPDVRGIIDDKIDSVKGCFNLPNLCGEELLEEVKKRRRVKIADHTVNPSPTYVALTMKDAVKRLTGIQSSDNEYDSRSEGYKTEPEIDIEDNFEKLLFNNYDGYIYNRHVGFEEDDTHCFMFGRSIRDIQTNKIGEVVCALLNTGKGGQIMIGVNNDGRVIGINISRKDRDQMRLGMDDLMERFKPRVTHDRYEVKFVEVMQAKDRENLEQYEERFVVEIIVQKNSEKLYQTPSKKMLYRNGTNNNQLTMQQIREKTIREQENRYQTEIRALRLTLHEAREQLKIKL